MQESKQTFISKMFGESKSMPFKTFAAKLHIFIVKELGSTVMDHTIFSNVLNTTLSIDLPRPIQYHPEYVSIDLIKAWVWRYSPESFGLLDRICAVCGTDGRAAEWYLDEYPNREDAERFLHTTPENGRGRAVIRMSRFNNSSTDHVATLTFRNQALDSEFIHIPIVRTKRGYSLGGSVDSFQTIEQVLRAWCLAMECDSVVPWREQLHKRLFATRVYWDKIDMSVCISEPQKVIEAGVETNLKKQVHNALSAFADDKSILSIEAMFSISMTCSPQLIFMVQRWRRIMRSIYPLIHDKLELNTDEQSVLVAASPFVRITRILQTGGMIPTENLEDCIMRTVCAIYNVRLRIKQNNYELSGFTPPILISTSYSFWTGMMPWSNGDTWSIPLIRAVTAIEAYMIRYHPDTIRTVQKWSLSDMIRGILVAVRQMFERIPSDSKRQKIDDKSKEEEKGEISREVMIQFMNLFGRPQQWFSRMVELWNIEMCCVEPCLGRSGATEFTIEHGDNGMFDIAFEGFPQNESDTNSEGKKATMLPWCIVQPVRHTDSTLATTIADARSRLVKKYSGKWSPVLPEMPDWTPNVFPHTMLTKLSQVEKMSVEQKLNDNLLYEYTNKYKWGY